MKCNSIFLGVNMKKYNLFLLSLISVFLILNYANASDNKLIGTWQGNLDVSGQPLRILFHCSLDENNQLIAKMDSPDQGAKGIPVSSVLYKDGDVLFSVESIGGVYTGKLQDGDKNIKGTWKQGGYELPLNLKKSTIEPIARSRKKSAKTSKVDSDVILETPTGKLFGTLEIPNIDPPFPVALIIAGSGPTDRDGNNPRLKNNSLKMLANELLKNGIATLRYDKRGIGKSKNAGLKESDLRFENYIEDANGWCDFLEQDGRFGDIIIIGHSEGSLIGMISSQQKNVAKFISIAGAGQSADKILKEQLLKQPQVVWEQASPILGKIVNGDIVENVPPMLNSLFRPSVQPYMMSWFKYDPQKEIAKLEKPVLIIHGTTDIQVSLADADRLAKANPQAEKQIIDGMNHIMKEAELERQKNIQTYSQPGLPLKKGLGKIIVDFIK